MKPESRPLEPRTPKLETRDAGFTLIELLIVMSIIIVLMLLAIPQALKLTKNANQTSAVQTMKTLAAAEMSYNSAYPTTGFGCPIAVLGGDPKAGPPSAQAAQIIDPALATTGIKSGYVFTVTCGDKKTVNNQDIYNSVEITGVPLSKTKGDNGYCSDENNLIKVDPTGGTNCTQSLSQ